MLSVQDLSGRGEEIRLMGQVLGRVNVLEFCISMFWFNLWGFNVWSIRVWDVSLCGVWGVYV